MLLIENLTKRYGETTAVADLSLHLHAGELYAFLGPNGAGKTTTIKCVAGLLWPTSGSVRVCGHDVRAEPVAARRRLSYVPDQPYLYEKLSGREFLAFVGRLYGLETKACRRRIGELLEMFDAAEWADGLSEGYSHGMRQKIVLSAALLHEPDVILIDEPMVGLDPRSSRLVRKVLRERAESGCAILMSTHTLNVAEEVADRIGIMHRGRMVADGTWDELRTSASESLEDVFLELTADVATGAEA
ncbi:ABC transporter ATP-binding protein [bacterium]|nr:ABC transporter ATP-binding protein [bacterium]